MILSYTRCWTKQKLLDNFSSTGIFIQKLKKKDQKQSHHSSKNKMSLCFSVTKYTSKLQWTKFCPFFSLQDLGAQSLNAVCKVKYAYAADPGFSIRPWQFWCQWLFKTSTNLESLSSDHPMVFLVSQYILQRPHENTRNWYFLEEMCETIIVKLSNLDGQGDVNSRLRACQEAKAKWK